MPVSLSFSLLPFEELDSPTLYEVLRLRQRVFVLEQQCPYVDADNLDQVAWHLMGRQAGGELSAYTRLLPEGAAYEGYVSIGRIVTAPEVRGQGHGRALMDESLKACRRLFGDAPIKIMAQQYLLAFYEAYGFRAVSAPFLEDGIYHVDMVKT